MAVRRVTLILPEDPASAVLELAHALQRALAPRYKVHLKRAPEDGGAYVDDDSTPVAFRPTQAPLVIRLSEGESTLT